VRFEVADTLDYDITLACEFIQEVPYMGLVGLVREMRDTLLAMDEPERLIRGLFHLLSDNATEEVRRDLAQSVEEASLGIKKGCRDTACRWAKELVGQGVCKLILGEQYGFVSGVSWRMYEVLQRSKA